MALHVEGPLPHQPPSAYLLVGEALGEAFLLCGTTVGSRLTNPVVAAVLLTPTLLLNLAVTHVHLPHPATPAGSQMYWPQVAGSVILMSGVVFTYVLEIWRRYKLSKRKKREQAQLVEMLDQEQEESYLSETFVVLF